MHFIWFSFKNICVFGLSLRSFVRVFWRYSGLHPELLQCSRKRHDLEEVGMSGRLLIKGVILRRLLDMQTVTCWHKVLSVYYYYYYYYYSVVVFFCCKVLRHSDCDAWLQFSVSINHDGSQSLLHNASQLFHHWKRTVSHCDCFWKIWLLESL